MASITRRISASAAAVLLAAGTAVAVAPGVSAQTELPTLPTSSENYTPPEPGDSWLTVLSQQISGPITVGSPVAVYGSAVAMCTSDLTEGPPNACF